MGASFAQNKKIWYLLNFPAFEIECCSTSWKHFSSWRKVLPRNDGLSMLIGQMKFKQFRHCTFLELNCCTITPAKHQNSILIHFKSSPNVFSNCFHVILLFDYSFFNIYCSGWQSWLPCWKIHYSSFCFEWWNWSECRSHVWT